MVVKLIRFDRTPNSVISNAFRALNSSTHCGIQAHTAKRFLIYQSVDHYFMLHDVILARMVQLPDSNSSRSAFCHQSIPPKRAPE